MAARKRPPPKVATPVLDALNQAVKDATHLGKLDEPAIEAARALARKIDLADLWYEKLSDYNADHDLRPPSQDNVSIPTFLKFCESLGLTPAGREKLTAKKPEAAGGTLGKLRIAHGRTA